MRLIHLAGLAAVTLSVAGCAPELMATHAVPAQHDAPSVLTQPEVESAEVEAVEAARDEAAVQMAASADSQWRDLSLEQVAYSDADQLAQVAPSFRDYAVQAMSAADTDGCTVLGLSVMSVHPDGFVLGSISTDCGGGQAIWREADDGRWEVAKVLQAAPRCAELSEIGLPPGVGLLCEADTGMLRDY